MHRADIRNKVNTAQIYRVETKGLNIVKQDPDSAWQSCQGRAEKISHNHLQTIILFSVEELRMEEILQIFLWSSFCTS